MKVQIEDKRVFEQLNPSDLVGYLRSQHWIEVTNRPGHSSDWQKDYRGETADLLVPVDRTYRDFGLRMADAVMLVAAMEDRSQLAVVEDIRTGGMDVLRIQVGTAQSADGTLALERATALYDNVSELFSAGACAAQQHRVHYGSRKSRAVGDFVKRLRFGQTEFGSYVVRVFSPVPPALDTLFGPTEEPFERRAMSSLVRGLLALRTAADRTLASGDGRSFEGSVSQGVSANLCDAVANIGGEDCRPEDALVFRLTPARNRPLAVDLPVSVSFPGDRIAIIREAARVLKATAPLEDQEIQGYVVKLQSRDDGGIATVSAVIDGQARKVTVALPHAEHTKAILAYEKRTEIVCRGDLTRSGQLWTLFNPGRIELLSDEDEDG